MKIRFIYSFFLQKKKIFKVVINAFILFFSVTVFSFSPNDIKVVIDGNDTLLLDKKSEQAIQISGTILDANGQPLAGATILEKGTTNGVLSDFDGNFTIEVANKNAVIIVSYVGFLTQEIPVGAQTKFSIVLEEDAAQLDEVVLIGYGSVRKVDLTGAVATLSDKDFNLGGPVTTPEELIQGRAAGVQVSTVSAAPGSEPIIRIRGNNSILGSNQPLYVVDGMPMASLNNMVNVQDIESMQILKDASSTAIYGTRGANGVVIITTKRGKNGRTNIDYSYELTFDAPSNLDAYELSTAQEYMEARNTIAQLNNAPQVPYTPERMAVINKYGKGTNWLDELTRTGIIKKHNISVSSGTEKSSTFLSVHYMDQEGVIPNTNFNKLTSKFNYDQKLLNDKLKISMSSLLSKTKNNSLAFGASNTESNILRNVFKGSPIVPVNWDGWTEEDKQIAFADSKPINPLEILEKDDILTTSFGITSNLMAEYQITKDLSFAAQYGVKLVNTKGRHFLPQVTNLVNTDIQMGSAHISESIFTSENFEGILRYSKEFGNHNVKATAILSNNPEKWESFSAASSEFVSDNLTWNNLGAGAVTLAPSSSIAESNLVSYTGRVEYGFKDLYNLTATFRRDGSSKFGSNNKWGNFPSIAAAWKIHNESFFNVDFISMLKLRGGWGKSGSDGFPIGAAQPKFAAGYAVTLDSDNIRMGLAAANLGNPNLQWETTTATNIGLELGFLNDRISLEFDVYNKKTDNLLWNIPVPASLGFSTRIENVGASQNKGFEILLSTINVSTNKFNWSTDITFAKNENKIKELKLAEGKDFFPGPTVGHGIQTSILKVGESIGTFYGYQFRGILQEGQTDALQPSAQPGDALWEDIDGDGVFSSSLDRTILGKGIPTYTFGINNSIKYGNIYLAFFFQGVADVEILNLNNLVGYSESVLTSSLKDRWTPSNTSGTLPTRDWAGTDYAASRTYYTNSATIEDGSYITLKSLSLSYTIPTQNTSIDWIRNLAISFTGRNLFTINSYSGFYPEVNSTNAGGFDARVSGVDSYAYPMSRSFSLGINVGF